ncbi:hypothetical protein BVG80_11830 [Sphingobacteriales bacterium TSM_CSM]|nr:hypothetical protein BVG80_11830 [Sphingobacteriales bacterium TSM_CSM]
MLLYSLTASFYFSGLWFIASSIQLIQNNPTMIALRIETSHQQQAQAIAELLLREALITDVSLYKNVPSLRLRQGAIAHTHETVIAATTQPALYASIEKRVRDFCKDSQLPFMYSMPI